MDDLISRQAAIRWVKTECNPYGNPTLDFESGKKVIEHLEQMPSAERRGRWVIKGDLETEWYRITCSECGEDVTSTAPCIGFLPNAKVIWDYCPYCGARMNLEDEAEE